MRALKVVGLVPSENVLTPAQISNFEAGIALQQLGRLDELVAEKIRVANLYRKHVSAAPVFEFPQFATTRFLSRFMLRAPAGVSAEGLREKLKTRNIHTRRGYPLFASGPNSTPRAHAASSALIEAPFHRGIEEASVRHFCEVLGDSSR
jgi:dTDP-4-amino-4,6-dideoxygalactose transaminase